MWCWHPRWHSVTRVDPSSWRHPLFPRPLRSSPTRSAPGFSGSFLSPALSLLGKSASSAPPVTLRGAPPCLLFPPELKPPESHRRAWDVPPPGPVPDTGCGPEPLVKRVPLPRAPPLNSRPARAIGSSQPSARVPRPPRAEIKRVFHIAAGEREKPEGGLSTHTPSLSDWFRVPTSPAAKTTLSPSPPPPVTPQQGLSLLSRAPPTLRSLTLSPHSTAREAPFQDTRGSSCSPKQNPTAPLHFSWDRGEDSVLGQSSQPISPPQAPLHPALQPHRPATPPCHLCHHTSHTPLPTPLPRPLGRRRCLPSPRTRPGGFALRSQAPPPPGNVLSSP